MGPGQTRNQATLSLVGRRRSQHCASHTHQRGFFWSSHFSYVCCYNNKLVHCTLRVYCDCLMLNLVLQQWLKDAKKNRNRSLSQLLNIDFEWKRFQEKSTTFPRIYTEIGFHAKPCHIVFVLLDTFLTSTSSQITPSPRPLDSANINGQQLRSQYHGWKQWINYSI